MNVDLYKGDWVRRVGDQPFCAGVLEAQVTAVLNPPIGKLFPVVCVALPRKIKHAALDEWNPQDLVKVEHRTPGYWCVLHIPDGGVFKPCDMRLEWGGIYERWFAETTPVEEVSAWVDSICDNAVCCKEDDEDGKDE